MALTVALSAGAQSQGVADQTAQSIVFDDITESAGISFRHDNGLSGNWHYPELIGGGCGLADLTGDGLLDVILVQSGALPRRVADRDPPDRSAGGGTRILANRSTRQRDGSLQIQFEDITRASGLRAHGYGIGVATADLTGNGHVDLYITNYGPNSLWRNNGDGTFTDISDAAGASDSSFSTSAAVADLNQDGRLDLFVTNYVAYDPQNNPTCLADSTKRDYCGPSVFEPAPDTLYLNKGDERFHDVTDQWLKDQKPLRGLGVGVVDLNEDGRPDVFVANDGDMNQFWSHSGDDYFEERALASGTAVNRHGQMEAGMGVAIADIDRNGTWDILLTHLTGESNTLYRNRGDGQFVDDTAHWGLQGPSLPYTGFGAVFGDFDLDGWSDLFVANGAVRVMEAQREAGIEFPLRQRDQLFINRSGQRFDAVAGDSEVLSPAVGRGAALGDIDNDGRLDLLVCNNNDRPRLLHNRTTTDNAWLGLRMVTDEPARDAIGTLIALLDDNPPAQWQRVTTDGSYISARDPRVVFGLGAGGDKPAEVLVIWPDGSRERFGGLASTQYHTLAKGNGNIPE